MGAQYLSAAAAQGDKNAEALLVNLLGFTGASAATEVQIEEVQIEEVQIEEVQVEEVQAEEIMLSDATLPADATPPLGEKGQATPKTATVTPTETSLLKEGEALAEDLPVRQSVDQPILLPTTWILEQNPSHYTIQVMGLGSKEKLVHLVRDYSDYRPFAVYTLHWKREPLHLLVQGVYTDVEAARKAKKSFPAAIQKPKNVWIRKFGKIQELINLEGVSN